MYCVWLVVELAFCYRYIIETRNRTLEETAVLFDGVDASELIAGPEVPDVHHFMHEKTGSLEEDEKSGKISHESHNDIA